MEAIALETARAVAYRFIAYAARSRAEIERRLSRGGFEADIVDKVIEECAALGWVDDRKFARAWVEDRGERKGYGRARLAAELGRKGIEKQWISEALDAIDDEDEGRRALAEAEKRCRTEMLLNADRAISQAEERRLASCLLRRGFSRRVVMQVLRQLMENTT